MAGVALVLCLATAPTVHAQPTTPCHLTTPPPTSDAVGPPTVPLTLRPARTSVVADIPLPGPAVRFDYQSLDPTSGRLYIAHMNADQVITVDVRRRAVVAQSGRLDNVHGVLAVPELGRLFATATGQHAVVALDAVDLRELARTGGLDYPDGLAFVPQLASLFVSDEQGAADVAFDAHTLHQLGRIPLGGEAGNTVFDAGSGCVLVAVHQPNELAAIDPATLAIVAHVPLPGVDQPHGVVVDAERRLAFVAGEGNATVAVLDLATGTVLATHQVGDDPDVLAFDPGTDRLYVAAESGTLAIFQLIQRSLCPAGRIDLAHAHTVAVDATDHLVYLPLEDLNGRPVLSVLREVGR
jgi:DNA-binding beta-propeller fold protein YncE